MLLALNDPIWERLYGPSGTKNVSSFIARLLEEWDEALARELYWDWLQHQDTLYPVTYAALPYLWQISARENHGEVETLQFFSQVLVCAFSGPAEALNGLSLNIPDHHHPWIPEKKAASAR